MAILPARRDLTIFAGDSFSETYTIETDGVGVDMTGWVWEAEIRFGALPLGKLLATFATSVDLGDSKVTISLTPEETKDLPPWLYLLWDLQANVGSDVTTWLQGKITVKTEVTD